MRKMALPQLSCSQKYSGKTSCKGSDDQSGFEPNQVRALVVLRTRVIGEPPNGGKLRS
jgi:hypothetical protein